MVDDDDFIEEPSEPIKVVKIRILSPLLSKASVAESPISHLEVPIKGSNKTIIIDPTDRLDPSGIEPFGLTPIGPMGVLTPAQKTALPEQPFPAKLRRRFRFPELSYALNQWDLSEEGRRSISLVADELRKENKFLILSIEGHTDDVGSVAYNQTLSFKRAVAAATHLVLRDGFDPARIFVKGYGESLPIDDNSKKAGRARNRRVELLILVPEGYEKIELSPGNGMDGTVQSGNTTIDPLAIEQAIMEKTGAETARPVGAFSQVDK
jgi:hypothetical protein